MPIHPAGLAYLVLVGVLLPVLALRSAGRLANSKLLPSRRAMATNVFGMFAVIGVASWATARAIGIPWAVIRPLTARDGLLALGALALMLVWAPIGWRTRPAGQRARLRSVLPETPAQGVMWMAVALGAGIFEEIAWRGVLYAVVLWLVKAPWIAVTLCSLSFGFGHAMHGRRNILTTALVAVLFHALVLATGSLLPAMLVHFVYDAIAGFLFRELARREEARDATAAVPPA